MAEKEIEKILQKYSQETKRHFDVVAERLEDKISIVAEQVAINTDKISMVAEQVAVNTDKISIVAEQVAVNTEKITMLQKDMNEVKDTLQTIKLDIEFIKHELKQKIDRDEFAALEKRVSLLEAKLAQK